MNVNPNERPTAKELYNIFGYWYGSIRNGKDDEEEFSYKNSDAVYASRAFTFICDSQLIDLEVSNSTQLKGTILSII
ncbi:hypothetical protein RhiirA1_480097 [Rhizophagus irregularis]|uniref:Uncharacterized protein n=1 Tax=Rhizophagus irregularis TaxID=588596 RepID=A0A2N0QPT5_9GLOM|nr:hypothetical protein RhiirA1_480097 [Rhizophagus irregularis]